MRQGVIDGSDAWRRAIGFFGDEGVQGIEWAAASAGQVIKSRHRHSTERCSTTS